jgi:hypothetical protein
MVEKQSVKMKYPAHRTGHDNNCEAEGIGSKLLKKVWRFRDGGKDWLSGFIFKLSVNTVKP